MRHRHKNKRKYLRGVLLHMLPIISHVAAILGTIMIVLDALHHW